MQACNFFRSRIYVNIQIQISTYYINYVILYKNMIITIKYIHIHVNSREKYRQIAATIIILTRVFLWDKCQINSNNPDLSDRQNKIEREMATWHSNNENFTRVFIIDSISIRTVVRDTVKRRKRIKERRKKRREKTKSLRLESPRLLCPFGPGTFSFRDLPFSFFPSLFLSVSQRSIYVNSSLRGKKKRTPLRMHTYTLVIKI